MPSYVKNEHIIFASEHAYKTIYKEQGFIPIEHDKAPLADQEEPSMDLGVEAEDEQDDYPEESEGAAGQDDYSDDDETGGSEELDSNEAMPLSARVGLLTYQDLKAKAKELGIPKYANTKQEDLVGLVVEALEALHDS